MQRNLLSLLECRGSMCGRLALKLAAGLLVTVSPFDERIRTGQAGAAPFSRRDPTFCPHRKRVCPSMGQRDCPSAHSGSRFTLQTPRKLLWKAAASRQGVRLFVSSDLHDRLAAHLLPGCCRRKSCRCAVSMGGGCSSSLHPFVRYDGAAI